MQLQHSKFCACCMVACLAAGPAGAQKIAATAYPDKPVRIVVGYPPGGSSDFSARLLANRLATPLGQSIVVDNRGGAAGNIANEIVVKSAPDGYTLLVTAEASITINASVYVNLPFVAARDMTAITQIIKYANVVVVHPSLPVSSVKELIAYAKSQPGKLSYSHPGTGTAQQLAVELFKMTVGVDITSVPYKGGGPAMISLVGNETQLSFATPPSAIPQVKAGRLRAIAVTSDKRSAAMPELPTVSEAGLPGFNVEGWVGLFAPAKTPASVIDRLYAESAKILRTAEAKELALGVGSEPVGNTPQEANRIVREETAMWAKVVKTTGVRVE
ncbi:MAG: tripartite tricarboxylate transporter substrate binding protein [Burkholderiales bacterium]